MIILKNIKNFYLKIKNQKKEIKNLKSTNFSYIFLKTSFNFQSSSLQKIICINSLNPKNEIILDDSNIYINNKEIQKKDFDFTLYKDFKNCSTLYIRINSIHFIPGDEILVNLKTFNKNKITYIKLKAIYLYDNRFFLNFS